MARRTQTESEVNNQAVSERAKFQTALGNERN